MVTKSTKSYKIIKANICTAAERSVFHVTSTSRRLFSRSSFFSPDFGTYGVKSTHLYKIIKADICTAAERSVSHLTSTPCRHLRLSDFSPRRSTYIHFNKFIKNLNKFIQLYTNVLKSRFWGYPPPLPKKIWLQFFAFRSISLNFADWGSCMPLKTRLSDFDFFLLEKKVYCLEAVKARASRSIWRQPWTRFRRLVWE